MKNRVVLVSTCCKRGHQCLEFVARPRGVTEKMTAWGVTAALSHIDAARACDFMLDAEIAACRGNKTSGIAGRRIETQHAIAGVLSLMLCRFVLERV